MYSSSNYPDLGFVLIGRNEGLRLEACIQSLEKYSNLKIYVDSGSTDGSIDYAESRGLVVLHLDTSIPFTAARARNAGWKKLLELKPEIELIQFLDGDCTLDPEWLDSSIPFLQTNAQYAIACGQRKEIRVDASFYNLLCDIEWNTPVGDAAACGGDFLIRSRVICQVNGFRDDFIAGEEPEMCFRIRQTGYLIRRMNLVMTWHDADMHKFGQWWKRTKRCGYAYALGSSTHGYKTEERYKLRETIRALAWGCLIPLFFVIASFFTPPLLVFLVILYIYNIVKNYRSAKAMKALRLRHAIFMTLGKFAESQGIFSFILNKLSNEDAKIIEYKR